MRYVTLVTRIGGGGEGVALPVMSNVVTRIGKGGRFLAIVAIVFCTERRLLWLARPSIVAIVTGTPTCYFEQDIAQYWQFSTSPPQPPMTIHGSRIKLVLDEMHFQDNSVLLLLK